MPVYPRGRITPPDGPQLRADAHRRHSHIILPEATAPSYDARQLGIVGAVKSQGSCGSCWRFSGIFVIETAFNKAFVGGGPGVMVLSEQFGLDCNQNGGCNGDDNTTVLKDSKAKGDPLTAAYGPYQGRAGQCKSNTGPLYKIDDWGFAGAGGQSYDTVTPTQDIKNAIVTYGCVGCAVAAGSSWDSWSSDPNYIHHGNSNGIDHDVALVGWDDAKGAWIMRNSWGTGWACQGYGWIAYGADSIGTEAVWAFVKPGVQPFIFGA